MNRLKNTEWWDPKKELFFRVHSFTDLYLTFIFAVKFHYCWKIHLQT